jgi:hypothetical protein
MAGILPAIQVLLIVLPEELSAEHGCPKQHTGLSPKTPDHGRPPPAMTERLS